MNSLKYYSDFLKEDKWMQKCNEILYRDHFICQNCGKVGFHNGSLLVFNNLEEFWGFIDRWNWTIGSKPISKWIGNIIGHLNVHDSYFFKESYCDIDVSVINEFNGLKQYEIDTPIERVWDFPQNLFFVSSLSINTVSFYWVCYDDNLFDNVHDCNCKRKGNISILVFDKDLSNEVYLTVERKRGFDAICISFHDILICFESPYKYGLNGLNIHHKKYIIGRKPWEYDADSLVTLCENCHHNIHEKVITPILDESGNRLGVAMICDKCGGSGYLPQYKHVEHGICFKCKGEGVILDY